MTSISRRKTLLDFFPVPQFLLFSTTGIAITDNDTKFVQLKRELFGDKFELVHATKENNPKGAVEAGLIKNPTELASVLKKLAKHHGTRYAHAVLPEEKAYLFTTSIDWVSPEGRRDAVAFILEENAPVALTESVFNFEIINEDMEAGKIKLAVSVLPKDVVHSYEELLKSVGITPISFELESQAIARTVIGRGDKRPHLIINLSWKKTGFYVVDEGVVQFSTTQAYGVGKDDSHSSLNDLKAEMRKVLAFWNVRTSKAENKIKKAIICGAGTGQKDFIEKLMEGSNIEHASADIWLNMSPRHHISEMSFEESLDYVSAIGLVLSHSK